MKKWFSALFVALLFLGAPYVRAEEESAAEKAAAERKLTRDKALRAKRRAGEAARKAEAQRILDMHKTRREAFAAARGAVDSPEETEAETASGDTVAEAAVAGTETPEKAVTDPDDLHDGYYTGQSMGHDGSISVCVRVSNGKIRQIKVLFEDERRPRGVYYKLRRAMIRKNSSAVDAVSGATDTSNGFIAAVESALASRKVLDEPPERIRSQKDKKKNRESGKAALASADKTKDDSGR